ncbi:MAG: hypothetical protein HMLKMBBP_01292 [Planctomycetes bacterium]|nr:hypothetical protein [Planctomycetota bacterium]
MAEDDRARWDAKHRDLAAADAARGGIPGLPAALEWASEHLPREGRVLDVACGRGAAACELASRGFDVDAVDVSLVALGEARRLAERRGVSRRVRTYVADLDEGLPLGIGPFDLILCVHFHQPALWPALRAALRPGGVLVMETMTTVNADRGEGSPSRRFLVAPGALRGAADGLRIAAFDEGDHGRGARHVARLCAVREPSAGAGR